MDEPDLFGQHEIKIINQKPLNVNFKEEIQNLQYIFRDPVMMDRKIDPKKLQFGSKIDKNSKTDVEYYSVKSVVSPNTLEMNNGLLVRLIGVDIDKSQENKAIQFMEKKVKGQKVFFKYDEIKYDHDNKLLCYLYLKNKTFVNAHIIKSGFVTVDLSMDYRYKNKFKKYLKIGNG